MAYQHDVQLCHCLKDLAEKKQKCVSFSLGQPSVREFHSCANILTGMILHAGQEEVKSGHTCPKADLPVIMGEVVLHQVPEDASPGGQCHAVQQQRHHQRGQVRVLCLQ